MKISRYLQVMEVYQLLSSSSYAGQLISVALLMLLSLYFQKREPNLQQLSIVQETCQNTAFRPLSLNCLCYISPEGGIE